MISLTKLLLRTLLWCLFLTLVCRNISHIYWGWYGQGMTMDRGLYMPGVINLSIALVGLLSYKFLKTKCSNVLNRLAKVDLFRKIPNVFSRHVAVKVICLGSMQVFILFALAATLHDFTLYSTRDLAHIIDGLGQYEIGEHVYSLFKDTRGTTLASTCGYHTGHDYDKKELKSNRLNRCVAEVYGPESLQMANRYAILGGHLSVMEEHAESAEFRRKAIQLYKQLNKPDQIVENLGFLAFEQIELGDKTGAKTSINEAIEIVDNSDAPWSTKLESLRCLDPAASCVNKKWAEEIRSGRAFKRTQQSSPRNRSRETFCK